MKTIAFASLSLLLVTACSFGAEDAPPPAPPQDPSRVDAPPPAPPLEGTPVDSELTEKYGIFVAPTGDDASGGSRALPLRSIAKAIAMAKSAGKRVYACQGDYAEAIELADGIPMVGGLTCAGSIWQNSDARSRLVAPTSPVVRATSLASAARIEGFDFVAPDASAPSHSSFALIATDSPRLVFARSRFLAGRAAPGKDGVEGAQLSFQSTTPAGVGQVQSFWTCPLGKLCGFSTPPMNGGAGGVGACLGAPDITPPVGGRGGTGGVWGWNNDSQTGHFGVFQGNQSLGARPGEAFGGGRGASGVDGASGQSGTFTAAGFVPADGRAGADGKVGEGGKGGDGVPTTDTFNTIDATVPVNGNSGSGGGAGGCPGLAGMAGTGGGASIAALLFASPITFEGSELVAGDGGAGGKGTFGSSAVPGGPAGGSLSNIPATRGAHGGAGGAAGISGHGAGGPSLAVAHTGGAPSLATSKATPGHGGAGVALATLTDTVLGDVKTIPASPAGVAEAVHAF